MDVVAWLHGLGLGQYERALSANDSDADVLGLIPDLASPRSASGALPPSRHCAMEWHRCVPVSGAIGRPVAPPRPSAVDWCDRIDPCRRTSTVAFRSAAQPIESSHGTH